MRKKKGLSVLLLIAVGVALFPVQSAVPGVSYAASGPAAAVTTAMVKMDKSIEDEPYPCGSIADENPYPYPVPCEPAHGMVVWNADGSIAFTWDHAGGDSTRYQLHLEGGPVPGRINWTSTPISPFDTSKTVTGLHFYDGAMYEWKMRSCYDSLCTTYGEWSPTFLFFWRYNSLCSPLLLIPEDGEILNETPYFEWDPMTWGCPGFEMLQDDQPGQYSHINITGPGVDINEFFPSNAYTMDENVPLEVGGLYTWKVQNCWDYGVGDYYCGPWSGPSTFYWVSDGTFIPRLDSPADGAVMIGYPFDLIWKPVYGADLYVGNIRGAGIDNYVFATWGCDTDYTVTSRVPFQISAMYQWKVKACDLVDGRYVCGDWSAPWTLWWEPAGKTTN